METYLVKAVVKGTRPLLQNQFIDVGIGGSPTKKGLAYDDEEEAKKTMEIFKALEESYDA